MDNGKSTCRKVKTGTVKSIHGSRIIVHFDGNKHPSKVQAFELVKVNKEVEDA
jgi:hypothetical protein